MASAANLVEEAFQLTIECGICTNVRKLRMLPCQHMMCGECLDTILKGPSKVCSFCKDRLTETRMTSYPVCRLASDLQNEIQQLSAALQNYHLTDKNELCESAECSRHIDLYCTLCNLFLCFRCSRESKCVKRETHKTEVYNDEFIQLYRARFESWKVFKQGVIETTKKKQTALVSDIKDKMSRASATDIQKVLEEVNQMNREIQRLSKQLAEQRSVLGEYEKSMSNISDREYIRLVDKLSLDKEVPGSQHMPAKSRQVNKQVQAPARESVQAPATHSHTGTTSLGVHSVILSKCCYDVAVGEGRILVGRGGGFDVVKFSKIHTAFGGTPAVRGVDTSDTGGIVSIQQYDNRIYTLCASPKPSTKRHVIVFDTQYNEVNRWSVPDYGFISNIAVVDSKVCVPDPDNKQVVAYSTNGTLLPPIKHSTFRRPVHLRICPPHHLLISDFGANRVYRVNTRGDNMREFTWTSTAVKDPRGVYCYNDEVWVWSRQSKSIMILHSDTGEVKQELKHSKFTDITGGDNIQGMCIRDGVLWAAARDHGLLKFPMNH